MTDDFSVDPELVEEIEAHFAQVDPVAYLGAVLTSPNPEQAMAAYEEVVTGEQDGDL